MPFDLDDLLDNMHGALKFFLGHLNGLRDDQWDWKAAPSCRSIREIFVHLCETYENKAALEEALAQAHPNVSVVQALFEAAAQQDYARLRVRYAKTPLDTEIAVAGGDWFLGRARVKAGTLLARRAWEECYHTGQVVSIRLATDPDWKPSSVYEIMSESNEGLESPHCP